MRLQPIFDIAEICFRKGIRDAVVCPGSRCAPLTLAFARHEGIQTRTISDERSAGFIGLGIAQQTKRPVVLICTSGTAAYNFAPAVAEAFYQGVPLVVLTADRPAEWIGQWDGQTISQQNIYGSHVKRSYQLPQEYQHADDRWSIQRIINEAVNLSETSTKGPVHVNVPLREPLYPAVGETIQFSEDIKTTEIIQSKTSLDSKHAEQLAGVFNQHKNVLIVGGQQPLSASLTEAIDAFSSIGNVAVVGDVISNLHALKNVTRYSDVFLPALNDEDKKSLRPDLLITFGQSVISKNLKLFLRANKPKTHWHIDTSVTSITDPFQSLTTLIAHEPETFFAAMSKSIKPKGHMEYADLWKRAESKAAKAIQSYFNSEHKGELAFVHSAMNALPDGSALHLANSMSVRYANFAGLSHSKKSIEVYSNRGTSGIDGCTSTAVGHALSNASIHTLITGDVAFFYDRNAFWTKYNFPNLRVIVLNNHGGAIFGVIDGPGSTPEGQEYFITEQRLSAKSLAAEFNIEYIRADDSSDHKSILIEFFKTGSRAKILEYETSSEDARKLFLQFKEQIKNTYAA